MRICQIYGIFALIIIAIASNVGFAQDGSIKVEDPFAPLPAKKTTEKTKAGSDLDRIYLKDKSILNAEIIGIYNKKLVLLSSTLGEIGIAPSKVERFSLTRDKIFYIQNKPLEDSRAIIVSLDSKGQLVYRESDRDAFQPFDFSKIYEMRPQPIPSSIYYFSLNGTSSLDWGNSEDTTFGVDTTLKVKSNIQEIKLKFEFSFSEAEDVVTQRLLVGSVLYRFYFSEMWGFYGNENFRKDELSGIDFYSSLNAGITYRAINTADTSLNLDVGFGYTYEDLTNDIFDYLSSSFNVSYNQFFDDNWEFKSDFTFSMELLEPDRWQIVGTAELQYVFSMEITFGCKVEETYKAQPTAGFKNNDIRLVFTIGMNYRSDKYFKNIKKDDEEDEEN